MYNEKGYHTTVDNSVLQIWFEAPLVYDEFQGGYRERYLFLMINEAARALYFEDHIVDTPDEVDLGMIMGTGFLAISRRTT